MANARLKRARQSREERASSRYGPAASEEPLAPTFTARSRGKKTTVLPGDDANAAELLMNLSHPPKSNEVLEREREERLQSWIDREIDRHTQPKTVTKGVCAVVLSISASDIQSKAAPSLSNISLSEASDLSEGLDATPAPMNLSQKKSLLKRKAAVLIGSDSEDKDLDSDPGTFDIKYEITLGKKARVDCVLDNNTTFSVFRQRIASEMGIPLQQLSALGYIASFWPRSPKPVPKLVDTDARYEDMVGILEEYMKVEYTKHGKPKKKKAFSVILIDTGSESDGKKSSKAKSHDNEGPALENNADEQEVLIIRQIVKNFSCAEHPKKACYVTTNGLHYAFTAGDLSIWAGLVRKHEAVLKTPPEVILQGIGEKAVKQGKYGVGQASTAYGAPPHWGYSYPPPPPLGYYTTPAYPGHYSNIPAPNPGSVAFSSPPSSPQKPAEFPHVNDWLAKLDSDEYRGRDNHNYIQFTTIFAHEELTHLDDLHLIGSADKLRTLLACNLGNANRLWKYIVDDMDSITGGGRSSKKRQIA
ncbi:hypothetical protein C8R41DRAFT_917002 [Lentinula lateritia]|uniref:SAM domain-containing protein n=1 Tax=Lentinula lateritia TaxID=40482 RepID=A0ABQ8VPZ8_9AGAR|nr:hypothetical protein C8R41DRAFT_917002 [Lentinula lateritia]